jgi:hypothetical protein
VSVAHVDVPLTEPSLREHFLGLPVYRRTRFVLVRGAAGVALLRVHRERDEQLFAPVTQVQLLAGPGECAWVDCPDADTAIPSRLAEVALREAPGARAVAVHGRYQHVNVILDPHPVRILVRDVVPPRPAKLLDQARRIVDTTEDLPPVELVPQLVDLDALARAHPAGHYLLPCRGSGGHVPGATVSYLDEHPPRADWLRVGCERSRQIHRAFYGSDAPGVELCPLATASTGGDLLLTKCCLQEEHIDSRPGWVSVPWGASLEHLREALHLLAARGEPRWQPA